MGITSDRTAATSFGTTSNGQTSVNTNSGVALFSDQDATTRNGPIYWDSLDQISGYGPGVNAVQLCLQSDSTFLVQNSASGATNVMMCDGIVYLMGDRAAANSGCAPITLMKGA